MTKKNKTSETTAQYAIQNVSGSFSWKKLLHNFCYWTNPFYMLSTDLKNSPKAKAFIVEHFGHILEPTVIWLAKILNKFERRK